MSEWKETEIGRLPSHWVVGVFEKDLKIQGRIGWKGYKTSDLVPFGPYVVGGAEIKSSIFLDLKNAQCLSRVKYEESPEIMLKDGDVLLVTRGNLGEVGYYHKMYGEGTINPSVIILNNFNGDSKFLFYYLISKQGNSNVMSLASGSSVPAIYQGDVKTLRYPRPPIEEQAEISKVAFSIDLKIDLLHRQNTTLEQMAETLFRKWFVYEAKEEWEDGRLRNLIVVKYGKDHKKLIDGKIPVIGSGGIMRYANKALYEKESVLIPRKGSLNNVMYIDEPFWTVDTMFYTEMKRPNIAKFIYHFVKDLDLASMNVGSAVPSLTTELLNNMPIDIPSDSVFEKFEYTVEPFYKKMKANQIQIRTLIAIRDTLLPKLMSGDIIVEI